MLKEYSVLKAKDSVKELAYVVFRLAYFYSTPDNESLEKAESYFLENEVLDPGAGSKQQTALFYFDVLENPRKAISKVGEIKLLQADRDSYYSALTLKGQAQIKLGVLRDAGEALEKLISLIKKNPKGLPYGDEINLLEAAVSIPILAPKCHELLELIGNNARRAPTVAKRLRSPLLRLP